MPVGMRVHEVAHEDDRRVLCCHGVTLPRIWGARVGKAPNRGVPTAGIRWGGMELCVRACLGRALLFEWARTTQAGADTLEPDRATGFRRACRRSRGHHPPASRTCRR